MIGRRNIGSTAAISGLSVAIGLLTGVPAASADELADLRANQELLQRRLDQLSQVPTGVAPSYPYVPGFGPETHKDVVGTPVVAGSFPRSFLIPGTDTSLRIGGFVSTDVLWYLNGANQGSQLNGQGGTNNQTFFDGQGGTGNLASIPLNNSISRSRSSAFDISPRTSRFLFDARTPTAWGEVKAYLEMDFAYNNTAVAQSSLISVASGWLPRLRKAYGTFGGFEAGQDTGILHDPDADPELVDQGGETGTAGRAREPQVKYTFTGPYGSVFTIGGENPAPRFNGPFGQVDIDVNQIPNIAACTTGVPAGLQTDVACLGNQAFLSPLQSGMPEWIATARINQPWGHFQIGAVVREDKLNDGQYLNQTYIGYGGTASFDVHPFPGDPGPWGKDDIGGGVCAGSDIGGQCANGSSLVTNFGLTLGGINPLTNSLFTSTSAAGRALRQSYDALVRSQVSTAVSGWLWYQHWWTNEIRSTIDVSGNYNGMNTTLLGPGTTNNKILALTHANLYWSPVAFVDFGLEYAFGHRVTVANFRGDASTIEGLFRVRF